MQRFKHENIKGCKYSHDGFAKISTEEEQADTA